MAHSTVGLWRRRSNGLLSPRTDLDEVGPHTDEPWESSALRGVGCSVLVRRHAALSLGCHVGRAVRIRFGVVSDNPDS